jgi:hypothetical protein
MRIATIGYGLIALLGCGALLAGPRAPMATAATTACSVDYQVSSQWATGFEVQITITNNGPAITSWVLQYSYTGNQQLQTGWDGNWSQSGQTVTVSNASWNGSVATGASVSDGANFSYSGTNTAPTAFTVNGVACNGGGTSTPPPSTEPTVSITSPTGPGSEVPSGSTVTVSATASAGDSGTISSVSFYATNYCQDNTTTEVGTATAAPYSVQWPDVPLGNFGIAAVVTTSQGVSVMSTAVGYSTTSDGFPPPCAAPVGEPVIAIVQPTGTSVLNSDTSVPVTADVSFVSSGGNVSSVTFTAVGGCGTTSTVTIGTATAAPYTVQWADPPGGIWTITAVADNDQVPVGSVEYSVTSAPVQVAAGPDGMPLPCPTVPPSPTPTPSPSA